MKNWDRLAAIAVGIGVNLQPGQELIVSAPVEAVTLVRAIAKHGYRAGAADVLVNFNDAMLARIHFDEGSERVSTMRRPGGMRASRRRWSKVPHF